MFQKILISSLEDIFDMKLSDAPLYRCLQSPEFDKRAWFLDIKNYKTRILEGLAEFTVVCTVGYLDYKDKTKYGYIKECVYKDQMYNKKSHGARIITVGEEENTTYNYQNKEVQYTCCDFEWLITVPEDTPKHQIKQMKMIDGKTQEEIKTAEGENE